MIVFCIFIVSLLGISVFSAPSMVHIKVDETECLISETDVETALTNEDEFDFSNLNILHSGLAVAVSEKDLPCEQKLHEASGKMLWYVNVYMTGEDAMVNVPVVVKSTAPQLVDGNRLTEFYEKIPCSYTLYDNGVCYLELFSNTDDIEVLETRNADAKFIARKDKNVKITEIKEEYCYINYAQFQRNALYDENTRFLIWKKDSSGENYVLTVFDKNELVVSSYDYANYLLGNDTSSKYREHLLLFFAYEEQNISQMIVSQSTQGLDAEGKYVNYYDLLDPYNGIKVNSVSGNKAYSSVKNAKTGAVESGYVVRVEDDVVDELNFTADDQSESYLGKIDSSDTSKGLVWIRECSEDYIITVPIHITENNCCETDFSRKINEYEYDEEHPDYNFDGKAYYTPYHDISYEITDNTVVSVLEYDENGIDMVRWGSIRQLDLSLLINGDNSLKCYSDKIIDGEDYVTKYAPYLTAYVYASDSSGSISEADFVLIIKSKLEDNQLGMFVSPDLCEKHDSKAPYYDEFKWGVSWYLDENGVLTISGKGPMSGQTRWSRSPWYDYRDIIKSIVIGDGITSISPNAFAYLYNVDSVSIPDSVVYISDDAFHRCLGLKSITLPDSVEYIYTDAFYDCLYLENIDLGNGLKYLDNEAFDYCLSLKEITLPASIEEINGLFPSDKFDAVYYEGDLSEWCKIQRPDYINYSEKVIFLEDPNKIGVVGQLNENLTWNVSVDGVLTISGNGKMPEFQSTMKVPWDRYRSYVNKLVIADGVTNVASLSFFKMEFEEVYIGRSVKAIEDSAFIACNKIKRIYYKGTDDHWFNIANYSKNECLALAEELNYVEFNLNIGDANGDEKINVQDVILLAQYCAGWESAKRNAYIDALDTDADGYVDVKDVVLLGQFCAGIQVSLG